MLLKRFRINLFFKIFLFSVGIVIATILIGLLFNLIFLDNFYINRKEKVMLNIVNKIEELNKNNKTEDIQQFILQVKEVEGIEIKFLQPNSHNNMMKHGNFPAIPITENNNEKFKIYKIPEIGATVLFYNKKLENGKLLTLTASLSVMSAHTHEIYIFNFLTGIVAFLFSAGVGIIFSRKITGDIEKLNIRAEKIANLNFPEKIDIERNDELGDLSRNIEKMAVKLATSIENMKSFVSNASHELKTPISILCTHAHALAKNQVEEKDKKLYYDILLKEGLEMKELTHNLLTISKIDAPEFIPKKEIINLKNIFMDSLEKYDFMEFEKDITIHFTLDDITLLGDSYLLKIAINNIISNALKYTPENGNIDIYKIDNKIFISNSTENFQIDETEKLWEPFTRGKNAQNTSIEGSGLGLSITKKALLLNKITSTISIENSKFIFCLKVQEVINGN